jgi:hypothetical protein
MNYSRIEQEIIIRAKLENRDTSESYFELHHIIPRCLGGTNDENNLVLLTGREHYMIHWLLSKIHKNYKLASAFNNMSKTSKGQCRDITAWRYEHARKHFSKFHPCKSNDIKLKISKSLTEYYKNNPKQLIKETRDCACGCGLKFTVTPSDSRKFLPNHVKFSEESKTKQSNSLKSYINSLTNEERAIRIKNSFGNCDHVARAATISKSKKGKSTNQQQIMGTRYAAMSDDEFNIFLSNKSNMMVNRMTNLRKKYSD